MRDRIDEELVSRRLARVLPGAAADPERESLDVGPPGAGSLDAAPLGAGRLGAGRLGAGRLVTGSLSDGSSGAGRSGDGSLKSVNPGRVGVKALVVVAVVVAAVAAFLAWRARPSVEPVGGLPPSSVEGSAPTPEGIVVSVAGRVRKPGLVRLPAGARVADAIEAAGGPLPGTDLGLLNLARKLNDGELVVLGVTPGPGGAPAGDGKVNLNTASLDQLQTLPGVGPVLAQRIVDHRERSGGFRKVEDLRQVTGIGESRYAELKDLVSL